MASNPQTQKPAPMAAQTLTLGKTNATVTPASDGTTSLRLVRVIKAPAERIYQAFLDADAYAKWLPPHGFTGHVHKMEPKVGGVFRMSFSTISKSWSHTFGGVYKELVPNKRIVHTDRFEDESMGKGEMTVTIDLKPVKDGTEVTIVQSGIPKGPAGEGAPYGWSQSLDNLATLCEQELPF
ncbi:MAG TPA: SRPBCC domain-containing protein [Candidatus Thermoplasmatota archaeon]|nr:SRPBCC domain-containing protein [Candidatus Thermoplasmatota archaeon]